MAVKVEVEYCGAWGYGPRFRQLQKLILEAVPGAKVSGHVGRTSSFEVTVNSVLVYSKLQQGKWPEFNDILKLVKEVDKGANPKPILWSSDSGILWTPTYDEPCHKMSMWLVLMSLRRSRCYIILFQLWFMVCLIHYCDSNFYLKWSIFSECF